MDGKGEDRGAEQLRFGRPGASWRAWVLSIVAAVALSAAATLLLGGSFRLPAAGVSPGGCGAAGNCCPPADRGK